MRADLGKDIAAAGVYISNYLFAFWQMDYQNLSACSSSGYSLLVTGGRRAVLSLLALHHSRPVQARRTKDSRSGNSRNFYRLILI